MEMVVLRNTMMAGYACAQTQASIERIHESKLAPEYTVTVSILRLLSSSYKRIDTQIAQ